MNGLYELETTDMADSTNTAMSAASTATLAAATARARAGEAAGAASSAWQGGTASLPLAGAAAILRRGSPSAQAWSLLRRYGAQGSDPMMKTGCLSHTGSCLVHAH